MHQHRVRGFAPAASNAGESSSEDDEDAMDDATKALVRESEAMLSASKAAGTVNGYRNKVVEIGKFCTQTFQSGPIFNVSIRVLF